MKKLIKEIEHKLNEKIHSYFLMGSGQCNSIYKIETNIHEYCLKIEKEDRPFDELNNLSIEGELIEHMNNNNINHIPKLVLKSNHYYIYEYIQGNLMYDVFSKLTEKEKILISHSIAHFHYNLLKINRNEALDIGVKEYKPENHKLNIKQHNFDKLSKKEIDVIKRAYEIYICSLDSSLPQLLHNDAHDKNIVISDHRAIFIDFGDVIWRDIHYDFYRYVYDYPQYWEIIVSEFEKLSKIKLNKKRIIAISLLRHLKALLGDEDKKLIISEKVNYYSDLLEHSM